MDFLIIVILLAIVALGYAHYKLHLTLAQIKADILAEIAKFTPTDKISKAP